MEILPFANVELRGGRFNVTAKVSAEALVPPTGVMPAVVILSVQEFCIEMECGFSESTPSEEAGADGLTRERCYQMPVADFILGTDKLSWYGESPLLWSLIRPEVGCGNVAFIATTSAVTYLADKHGINRMF